MSNFLVAGTSPDDYEDDAEAWRIHDCPVCAEPFREDRGIEVEERFYCSNYCARRRDDGQILLVKPQPAAVMVDGWSI